MRDLNKIEFVAWAGRMGKSAMFSREVAGEMALNTTRTAGDGTFRRRDLQVTGFQSSSGLGDGPAGVFTLV